MADGSFRPADQVRHTFHVQARAEVDILMRVLGPFAVQGAHIVGAELTERAGEVAIRVETIGLRMPRAELLMTRLRGTPAVLAVGLGWFTPAPCVAGAATHTID